MRLAEFIKRDMEEILAGWGAFAATQCPAAGHMNALELRDHAQQILEAVAVDLGTVQTEEAQAAKSMGLAPVVFDAPETAAQAHAVLRAKAGFDIQQLASEYRALRASVLSLWMKSCAPGDPNLGDLIRFNEAIDQALAESINFFSASVDRSRHLLIGMLSHDMRSPLQTVQMTARYLQQLNSSAEISRAATRLINSGVRMEALLGDLVDYNRSALGLGLRVTPAMVDLGSICTDEVDQIRMAHPDHRISLDLTGDCHGYWDGARIQQVLCNLVVNAVHYGAPGETIHVVLHGGDDDVQMTVANAGPAMDSATLAHIFEPLQRGPASNGKNGSGMGLGLFIANEVTRAHGGSISVTSDDAQTAFAIRLPRHGHAALNG